MMWVEGSGWWGPTAEVVEIYAGQTPSVDTNLINVWRYRGKVRWRKIGRSVWVCAGDVADAERDMHAAMSKS